MSVVIKVLFGEKLYRLAPETQTLAQVDREMKQRFPSIKQLKYFYKDAEIYELSDIIRQLASTGTTSLKITAKAEKSEALELDSSLLSEIKMSEPSPFETSQLLLKPQTAEPQSRLKLPDDFYICYNCSGRGVLQEFSITNLCMICKGKGKLHDNHKYVLRMKELYQLHFCPTVKANSILAQLTKPEKKLEQVKSEIKPVIPEKKQPVFCISEDKGYEMIANAKISKSRLTFGELFSVRFQFTNSGKDWNGKTIEMVEDKQHKLGKVEGRRLTALKSGQNMAVEIGPFVCRDESPLEKSYHLYFREGQKYIRFGHKFGFCAKAEKKVEVKRNNEINKERERIRDLKMLSGSKKSEEYLLMKLKSLGINLLQISMDDEVLIDLIKQIN